MCVPPERGQAWTQGTKGVRGQGARPSVPRCPGALELAPDQEHVHETGIATKAQHKQVEPAILAQGAWAWSRARPVFRKSASKQRGRRARASPSYREHAPRARP